MENLENKNNTNKESNEEDFFAQYIGQDLYGNGYRMLIRSTETPSGFTTVRTDTMLEMLEGYNDRKYSLTDSEFDRIPHEWKNIFSLGGSTITDFSISPNIRKSIYPEWIQLSVDELNERMLEGDLEEGRLLINKIYTERRPKELIEDGEVFDLTKKLLVEENILMEIEHTSDRINISFKKKV